MVNNIRKKRAGFSMLEVMTITAVSMIITMTAIPNMINGIGMLRLRSSMTSLEGVLQNCRMMAVKQNSMMSTHFSVTNFGTTNGVLAYVKKASDPNPALTNDAQVQLEQPITQSATLTGAGAPTTALDSSILGFTPLTTDPSFTTTGLPCAYINAGNCTTPSGFVFYFHDSRPVPNTGWAAISISPAGRLKKWFWTGSAWVN